jgi:hypothetical protein
MVLVQEFFLKAKEEEMMVQRVELIFYEQGSARNFLQRNMKSVHFSGR